MGFIIGFRSQETCVYRLNFGPCIIPFRTSGLYIFAQSRMFLKYPGKYVQQENDVYHSIQSNTPRNTKFN